jgi:hypothetical protein
LRAEGEGGATPLLEVLLFPRGAATGATTSDRVLEIPCWQLPPSLPQPASRAGLPFEPRPREKPRLTAKRTMGNLLEQARTSFAAFSGLCPNGPFLPLGGVKMRGHRIAYMWACDGEGLAASSAGGRYVPLSKARSMIEPQQRRFLDQLVGLVASGSAR